MIKRWIIALSVLLTATTAQAALSDKDRADIAQAESYMNTIGSLKARFLQVDDQGGQAEGTAYLLRPGRLRLAYDAPTPLLLVADGSFLIVDDKRYDNPSYIPLDSTPAGVLVRANVKLDGGDLKVVKVTHQPGIVTVGLVSSDDPGQGQLTLVFSERPFQLRQWQILDAQGRTTTVSLFDVQTGISLDKALFSYKDPRRDQLNIR